MMMGDEHAYQTLGIGSVWIKMHHDGIVMVESSEVTTHFGEKSHFFIFIGAFESEGCRLIIENDILKLLKGAMLMIKGILEGYLYFSRGSRVAGDTMVSCSTVDTSIL